MDDIDDYSGMQKHLKALSNDEAERFINYLSARLRVMARISYTRDWVNSDPDVSKHLTTNARKELVHAVYVVGTLTALGRNINTPPYLKRCIQGHVEFSKRFADEHDQVPDSEVNGLGDHWYTNLNARQDSPYMVALLGQWSEREIESQERFSFPPDMLTDEELLRLIQFYRQYDKQTALEIEEEKMRALALEYQRNLLRAALATAEREELKILKRRAAEIRGQNLFSTDSDSDSAPDSEMDEDKVNEGAGFSNSASLAASRVRVLGGRYPRTDALKVSFDLRNEETSESNTNRSLQPTMTPISTSTFIPASTPVSTSNITQPARSSIRTSTITATKKATAIPLASSSSTKPGGMIPPVTSIENEEARGDVVRTGRKNAETKAKGKKRAEPASVQERKVDDMDEVDYSLTDDDAEIDIAGPYPIK